MRKTLSRGSFKRHYSTVLAWGKNTSSECGLKDWHPVVLAPRPVYGLRDADVAALGASKSHSAAVLTSGCALTWGEGADGKLGHGGSDGAPVPSRVESLAERVRLTGVALGRRHSLFVDDQGRAWACGDGRHGQLGVGQPLQTQAAQQQQAWGGGIAPGAAAAAGSGPAGVAAPAAGSGGAAQATAAQAQAAAQASAAAEEQWAAQHAWSAMHLQPLVDHTARSAELTVAQSMYSRTLEQHLAASNAWRQFEALSAPTAAGLCPGSAAAPARVGGGRHALFSTQLPEVRSLAAENVVQVAACQHSSVALTAAGEVWTFGAAAGGADGAAPGAPPRPASGRLAALLAQHGGATRVAAGGSFCAALCASGAVVFWGAVRGVAAAPLAAAAASSASSTKAEERLELPHLHASRQGCLIVAEVVGLPPMVDVAAGAGHVLMTDGERVWALGRSAGAGPEPSEAAAAVAGLPSAAAANVRWLCPRELLRLPDARVTALRAGGFASAAVTDDGRLYLWGRLLAKEASDGMLEAAMAQGYGHWAAAPTADSEVATWKGWEGLGAEQPVLVPGLSGVRDLALGTSHALALVDG